jgi:hypothetical protein
MLPAGGTGAEEANDWSRYQAPRRARPHRDSVRQDVDAKAAQAYAVTHSTKSHVMQRKSLKLG